MSSEVTVYSGQLTPREAEINKDRQMLVATYGDGLPFVLEHYEAEIRRELRSSAESMLRAGARLLVVKECVPGEWCALLERVGLDRSTAARMMKVASRYAKLSEAAKERMKVIESSSMLHEMVSMPEADFAELAETGQTGDIKLDDVAKMSTREWREMVKRNKSLELDLEASRELARKKSEDNQKLQEKLDRALRKGREATPDESVAELAKDVADVATLVSKYIRDEGEQVNSLVARGLAQIERGDEIGICQRLAVAGVFDQIEQVLLRARARLGLPASDQKKVEVVDPVLDAKNWDDRQQGEVR